MSQPIIWAVEDSVEMQKTLRDIFTRLGCAISVFGKAENSLANLKAGARPDVMILDFRLPGMSGPQLFRIMGMDDTFKTIPVVPFTSHWEENSPSPMAVEWDTLALALAKGEQSDIDVIKKLEGDDFTIPERLILSVANILKSSPKGLPKVYEEAVLDLVHRVMAHLKDADL
ncbi:MAG: response regulator [Elusimicrobia bacterium]|nr:response regulator [Elusimicrobiota bacterium]